MTSAVPAAPKPFREPGMELVPGVHAIGPSTRGLSQGGYSRAYLFEGDDGLTLVDTLWDGDAHMILRYLWSIGGIPSDIKHIAMTHAHRSHLGGLATLKKLSGAPVYSHTLEKPIIERQASAPKIPLTPLMPIQLMGFRVASQLKLQPHDACNVDEERDEGQTVGPLTVMHMPGHTDGNLGFSYKDKVLAVADTVMTWPSFSAGWPRFNQNEADFNKSLKRVVALKPDVVCTGHGDPIWPNAAECLRYLVPDCP